MLCDGSLLHICMSCHDRHLPLTSLSCNFAPPAAFLPSLNLSSQLQLPGDFGFDPLGLGGNPEKLKWFAESERVHARWAMLAVAGILAQVGEVDHGCQTAQCCIRAAAARAGAGGRMVDRTSCCAA